MPSQNSPNLEPEENRSFPPLADAADLGSGEIQQELARLEEIILSSPHIPLTRRTLVDEEQLLDRIDLIRSLLPSVLQQAQAIVAQRQNILLQAEQEADEIIQTAQTQAAQIIDRTTIVQQADLSARQLQQQVQQECLLAQEENLQQIDRLRQEAERQIERMRQEAIMEAEDILRGADDYADAVLNSLEQQLTEALRIIYNGRRQLQPDETQQRKSA
ncbi:DivIVA domain-containing protein [Chroococcidiopsis sp.]|uniref:DivIVA domain-containing protein n=1 Tax=Chroococcidiopsis sp. TaxID=3088168 RepID=UPI003F2C8C38